MSSGIVHVILDGRCIGYSKWQGTAGVMASNTWLPAEEWPGDYVPWDGVRYEDRPCTCGEHTRAILYAHYAAGFWWEAPICLKCRLILGNMSMDDVDWWHSEATGHNGVYIWGDSSPTPSECKPYPPGCPLVKEHIGVPPGYDLEA